MKKCVSVKNKQTGKVVKSSSLNEKQWLEFLSHVNRKSEEFTFEYENDGDPEKDVPEAPKKFSKTELKRMAIPKRKEVAEALGVNEEDLMKLTDAIIAKQTELFGE